MLIAVKKTSPALTGNSTFRSCSWKNNRRKEGSICLARISQKPDLPTCVENCFAPGKMHEICLDSRKFSWQDHFHQLFDTRSMKLVHVQLFNPYLHGHWSLAVRRFVFMPAQRYWRLVQECKCGNTLIGKKGSGSDHAWIEVCAP